MSKNGSFSHQAEVIFKSKLKTGYSKHEDKLKGIAWKYIYSFRTLETYLDAVIRFGKWCKEKYYCKNYKNCRCHVDDYLQFCIDKQLSAGTIKKYACAIAKLYGVSSRVFMKTPVRHRADIKNNRGKADIDTLPDNQKEIARFVLATGLRREDLMYLRSEDYLVDGDKLYIHVRKGKGSKERYAFVINDKEFVLKTMKEADNNENKKVFVHIPWGMRLHIYRRTYAQNYYKMIARDPATLSKNERYVCGAEKKGIVYDRRALLEVSRSLGHNRVDVIADHYLD